MDVRSTEVITFLRRVFIATQFYNNESQSIVFNMDRRFILLISTFLYVNNIHCDGSSASHHQPIDFLKPTTDENTTKHTVITTSTTTVKTNADANTVHGSTTTPKADCEGSNGVKKFIDDVKTKFSHVHPVRDVKKILFGSSEHKTNTTDGSTTTTTTTTVPSVTTEKSHINKIIDSMPSESEDMIRVVTLKPDEHYGKGKAKPKYLTKELEKANTTEYVEGSTIASTTTAAEKSSTEKMTTSTSTQKSDHKN